MRVLRFAVFAASILFSFDHAIAGDLEAPNPSAYAPVAPPKPGFQGWYVGLTGGYDFATAQPELSVLLPGKLSPASFEGIAGGKIGGVAGYNAVTGQVLVGFEARASYAFAAANAETTSSFGGSTIPIFLGFCIICDPSTFAGQNFALANVVAYSQKTTRPFAGDLSARVGVIFDDWLFYGRAGAGAEYSKVVTKTDQTGTTTCIGAIVSVVQITPIQQGLAATGCNSIGHGPITYTTQTQVSPTVTLASGIERNFGNVFVRAEGEMMLHFTTLSVNKIYYSPAVNFAVGHRF
jgi:hypothetical protein